MLNGERELDDAFKALSDAGRRRILELLAKGEAPMGALTEPLDISLSGVHQHIAVLERAGLVACEKRGRERWCRLDAAGLDRVDAWIAARRRIWETRLDSLARHLERTAPAARRTRRRK
jgi:DNA-binding transcriptional ArsR family regulator